ncbi:MAG TPA: 50S ribosomal protein L21 [Candidatus Atribacteria bacterium]|nr:50S ribosomal protein L21 [Candidatus Atribacteria bacterium]HPU08833.1 50S ribosomal protein L21 [Candidatus Atribacteria bacterium]HPZ81139.1 50S ribosomal protein L21 [Candidatus Atribacteria bacterium]HQE24475.1 50S ribosomal protein L21 [Candidatus Atribacteria bacterium]
MFAIIEAQGKQYLVQEGSIIKLNGWLPQEEEEVVFDRVLMWKKDEEVKVGRPYLEGAKVTGRVVKKGKDKKVVVFKYKPKVNYRKKTGHRQPLTLVSIEKIEGE